MIKINPATIVAGILVLGLLAPLAFAERSDVTITAPGMKIHKKKGWFGSNKTEYTDALGNRYKTDKGWFGRKRTDSQIFGSRVQGSGDNIAVSGPNGNVLVKQNKSWLGGKKTEIDGDSIFQNVKDFWQNP